MQKRYFEFIGGGSAKFWEVQASGPCVTVRFGRIGTDGQTQIKTFPDAAAAADHADRQVRAKLAKGYLELVGS